MQIPTKKVGKFFVPEVVQTSEMDCGPASLKSLLEGFGIYTSYGRLREACQTSVDGTSIDSIEDLANKLGLDAEQIMLPMDHVLLEGFWALPSLVVTRTPSGLTHFVVAWNQYGPWIQLMDPGVGRRWVLKDQFIEDVFNHSFPISAADWRAWAGTTGFMAPLAKRMTLLKVTDDEVAALEAEALAIQDWSGLAALDAAVRLVASLVKSKALVAGKQSGHGPGFCTGLILALFRANNSTDRATSDEAGLSTSGFVIPAAYWSVTPVETTAGAEDPQLNLHGAVLIKVNGLREKSSNQDDALEAEAEELSPELSAILNEPRTNIEKTIWETLREDGWLVPSILISAFFISATSVSLQAFLFQGLFRFQYIFAELDQRVFALAALFIFLFANFLLELPLSAAIQRVGRRLETRLRIAFLRKIPLLSDRYFHSRLTSDMTNRAHGLRSLRNLPGLAVGFLLSIFNLALTVIGVIWLQPSSLALALGALVAFGAFGWGSHSVLEENDLRLRTHAGALSRFYLDALQGLLPLRTHGAERAFRREHEGLLTEWMRSNSDMIKTGLSVQGISALLYSIFSAWVGFDYIRGGGLAGGGLLLFYWTLNLPIYGQAIVGFIQQYPLMRNSLLRILEPLEATEENEENQAADQQRPETDLGAIAPGKTEIDSGSVSDDRLLSAAQIEMRQVSVVAGGHTILEDVNICIEAGEHLAVVGPSGAGKSSLVGVLLGWHKPASGVCLVDGKILDGPALNQMRRETAWVDPEVQIWNKTLLENLTYGNSLSDSGEHGLQLEDADLYSLLERLDNGLQTKLGEGGGLVSGGEGQRVRLARAMNRERVRLVILDEPFRGLDRAQRRRLLIKARQFWQDATLICVTHDVGETLDFQRVLVIENGHVIEDAVPGELVEQLGSRYADLLKAEERVRTGMWASTDWRHLHMENGELTEKTLYPGAGE